MPMPARNGLRVGTRSTRRDGRTRSAPSAQIRTATVDTGPHRHDEVRADHVARAVPTRRDGARTDRGRVEQATERRPRSRVLRDDEHQCHGECHRDRRVPAGEPVRHLVRVLAEAVVRAVENHLLEQLRGDVRPDDDHAGHEREMWAAAHERDDDDRGAPESQRRDADRVEQPTRRVLHGDPGRPPVERGVVDPLTPFGVHGDEVDDSPAGQRSRPRARPSAGRVGARAWHRRSSGQPLRWSGISPTLCPYISPSGSLISSTRAPSGSRKYSDEPSTC